MEKEMKVLHVEGVATHDGPESCVGVPRGSSEALTGERAGWAIEPRNLLCQGADALKIGGRPCHRRHYRESSRDPARSKNLGTYGKCSMHGNREVPRLPAGRCLMPRPGWIAGWCNGSVGREGNAQAVSPR
jgi:hypothetical protein